MSAYLTRGTDSSGRPIRMSREFADVWDRVVDGLGFTPVITQGGWMGTLAAKLSGPTHDGDALDLRVWNLRPYEVAGTIMGLRAYGIAAWLRNEEHGGFKDPHIHAVPGRWAHPSPAALRQWDACKNRRDGLASNGRDYHPYPLADAPPEDDMANYADQLDRIEKLQRRTRDLVLALARQEQSRDGRSNEKLDDLIAAVEAEG